MNRPLWVSRFARVVTAAGLAVDAVIHLSVATSRPPGGTISQETLFLLEGAASTLVAVLVLTLGSRLMYLLAGLTSITALAAVVLYRYADLGAIGPFPNMYEPFWSPIKIITAAAEAVATVTAAVGLTHPAKRLA